MGATSSSSRDYDPIGTSLRCDPDLDPASFPRNDGQRQILELPADDTTPVRTIGYAEYGAPSSEARHVLLFFHGTPGTRYFFSATHAAYAARCKVRVIVPERPGFGLSTPLDAGRTLRGAATDAMQVLDALELGRVHVVGYSAGGPPALAFACEFPTRCESVALISSLCPNARGILVGADLFSRVGYTLAAHAPRLLRALVSSLVPQARRQLFNPSRDEFTNEENDFFARHRHIRHMFAKSTLELYSRPCGATAEAQDYTLLARNWGFDLAHARGDFDIWVYGGGQDNKCTPAMFHRLVAQLPTKSVRPVFDEAENHLFFFKLFDGRLFKDIGILE